MSPSSLQLTRRKFSVCSPFPASVLRVPWFAFLTRPEVDALLAAPDRDTWFGRRDHAFILMAVQTELCLSEITAIMQDDLVLDAGAHVRVIGKGRKERSMPLAKPTAAVLKA